LKPKQKNDDHHDANSILIEPSPASAPAHLNVLAARKIAKLFAVKLLDIQKHNLQKRSEQEKKTSTITHRLRWHVHTHRERLRGE
jgi:hypothetical protein